MARGVIFESFSNFGFRVFWIPVVGRAFRNARPEFTTLDSKILFASHAGEQQKG